MRNGTYQMRRDGYRYLDVVYLHSKFGPLFVFSLFIASIWTSPCIFSMHRVLQIHKKKCLPLTRKFISVKRDG